MSRSRRLALGLAAAMAGAALLAAVARPTARIDEARASQRLEDLFPRTVGAWRVDELHRALVRPAEGGDKAYGVYDQVLERTYVDPAGQRVMLSAAYGGEQSVGLEIHRPDACYPSNGFHIDGRHVVELAVAGQVIPVTRLHAHKVGRSEPLTYWVVLGDAVVADGWEFRLRQLQTGLRGRLLDGMLVRLSSIDTDVERAYELQARFAAELAAALPAPARQRVVGDASPQR
ncbi:EpsI family protein [Schlegelella sp. S2-27]|uniref:EpsI family protein n=1 Tax=Caldimonas mangrovi TaxID=2944811 RepID=A0ABT0YKK8_9BURK|nr:exosortase-associated protein EpsI, B-type [Caldimonas mangrovi]MCM5679269.1 EpsI family protein [Caldimonas mangrovi]